MTPATVLSIARNIFHTLRANTDSVAQISDVRGHVATVALGCGGRFFWDSVETFPTDDNIFKTVDELVIKLKQVDVVDVTLVQPEREDEDDA